MESNVDYHPRKAAGSNSSQHHQSRQQVDESPEAASCSRRDSESTETKISSSRQSEAYTRTEEDVDDQSDDGGDWPHSDSSDEEWALLDANPLLQKSPSYDFPGTWPTAMRDTTAAISKVSSATASFASALTNSGVGKAGWSVSAALASSTNRGAFSLVNWATDRTGTGPDALPRPISKWLKNGREKMNEQRRAELWRRGRSVGKRAQTERSSEDWEADMGLQAPTQFGDNRGAFTLKITEMSSTGEILDEMRPVYKGSSMPAEIELEEQQWRVAATKGGLEVKADSKKESGDDNESEDLKDGGDGMLRLFQFDD